MPNSRPKLHVSRQSATGTIRLPRASELSPLLWIFAFTWIMIALALFGIASGLRAETGGTQAGGAVAFDPLVDRPLVLRNDTKPVYVLLRFAAPDIPPADGATRPPLNLALVLDRSGSMEDKGKIDFLKQAAKLAVSRLDNKDRLAIVEYDDQITLMRPSAPVTDKTSIMAMIDKLTPRGSTNLTGGMMRGAEAVLAQMSALQGTDSLSRVILLSDGLANTGITNPAEIHDRVKATKAKGVRFSAMGLGRDYDEDLMQAIAENGGGNYYYIEHPSQMARIFEQELQTLFTTVAKDASFSFEPSGSIENATLLRSGEDGDQGTTQGALSVDMEDFYAGESRAVILKIDPRKSVFSLPGSKIDLGRAVFTYTDVSTGHKVTQTRPLSVEVSDDQGSIAKAVNKDVVVEANLVETERAHAAAVAAYEKGDYDKAAKSMSDLEKKVTAVNGTLNDDRLAEKAEALRVEREQMATANASPEQRNLYLKSTKQRLYQAQSGKRALYALQVGDKGYEVERLQKALADKGYYSGPIDGVYSAKVKEAVEAVQNDKELDVDGVAGPATQAELGLY